MGSNQVIMNMFQKEDPFNPNSQFNPAHQEYYKDANQYNSNIDAMFKVEAGFQAVSEQILANINGAFDAWMKLSIEDKLL